MAFLVAAAPDDGRPLSEEARAARPRDVRRRRTAPIVHQASFSSKTAVASGRRVTRDRTERMVRTRAASARNPLMTNGVPVTRNGAPADVTEANDPLKIKGPQSPASP